MLVKKEQICIRIKMKNNIFVRIIVMRSTCLVSGLVSSIRFKRPLKLFLKKKKNNNKMDKINNFSVFACFSFSYDIHHKNKTHLISSVAYSDLYDIGKFYTINNNIVANYRENFGKRKKMCIIIVEMFYQSYSDYGYDIICNKVDLLIVRTSLDSLIFTPSTEEWFKEDFWNVFNDNTLSANQDNSQDQGKTENKNKKNFDSLLRDSVFIFQNIW
uniref:hypothetical protein n=1 Tax=Elmerina hispida TaxID=1245649 RepID=UPI0030035E2A|nr:hypothetical protein [Elmerina hispida]